MDKDLQKHTVYVIELEDNERTNLIEAHEYKIERTLKEYKNLVLNQNLRVTGTFYFINEVTRKHFYDYIDYVNYNIVNEKYSMGAYTTANRMLHTLNYFCKKSSLLDVNKITKENNNEQ